MNELSVDATIENLDKIVDFVDTNLDSFDCPIKSKIEIDIALDEIFSNIVHYAYEGKVGKATIRIGQSEDKKEIIIQFIDSGVPYNPLLKEDPNVNLSAEERKVGGLGIYIVKKSMDKVEYEHKNNQNILTIKKVI